MWNLTSGLSSPIQVLDGTASKVLHPDLSTDDAMVIVEIAQASPEPE